MLSENQKHMLENKALAIRIDSIRATTASQSGHPTSCLSASDIISVLFFSVLNYDYENPLNPNNDRFILSKGHAIPVVYATLKQIGVISDSELLSLRKVDSRLEGHPTPRFPYNEAATGSLGQGLSIGLGMALNARFDKRNYKTYVMMGDGEVAEGSIWEAAELASFYKLNNLIGILDCNRLGQSDETQHGHEVERYRKKFEAFGWKTCVINGHDINEIYKAFEESAKPHEQPFIIIAKTMKGYGLEACENKEGFHGKPFKKEEAEVAIARLKERFAHAASFQGSAHTPPTPQKELLKPHALIEPDITQENFKIGSKIATRKAYGYALAALGRASKDVYVLDADVKNSTFTELFEKEFPNRFVQCFIAEQNMVGISAGLALRGKIPFAATFGAFFSRAFDQIRMAGIGHNALRLCGSHCGVSIGEDGPSQMALEDLAMMRSVPNSIVLYPSDATSAYKLCTTAANYHDGVSYLRTTRMETPILYSAQEEFPLGGCKVLRQSNNDVACLVGAGVTLHEALKAYELLAKEGISVSVIDLYSIKPLDSKTLTKVARKSREHIITIEDHYKAGGIGEAVSSSLINENIKIKQLYVHDVSRSGQPEELLALAGIDAKSIYDAVKEIL
jgi:transketolase